MIFIDTGALIARFVGADQHHAQALPLWKRIEQTRPVCVTSNLVLSETLTYLGRHVNYPFAVSKGKILYTSHWLGILRPTEEEETAGLRYFEKFADQEVSFTDCVSFALMHKRKIREVFSFDHHFSLAGFEFYR
jgi:predicted nucleic acid-binding protein